MQELCDKYGIPTAAWARFSDAAAAKAYARSFGAAGCVIKASGLAAGKGVTVARSTADAEAAINAALRDGAFGDAGAEIVVEELLEGEEVSLFALVDGRNVRAFGSAQDHKAAWDGDRGPNTGGMGAYAPAPALTRELEKQARHSRRSCPSPLPLGSGGPTHGMCIHDKEVAGRTATPPLAVAAVARRAAAA